MPSILSPKYSPTFKELDTAADIKQRLYYALRQAVPGQRCALLHCPSYPNFGDHLIWLGSLFYLQSAANCQVVYTASDIDFSKAELERHLPEGPIVLLGGGSFGDLWYSQQQFREQIIERYHDRPIVILPQTIYFRSPDALTQARRILNSHPNLTLFVRDRISYRLACQAFNHCRVLMAPDAAFELADVLRDVPITKAPKGLLYHRRRDLERQCWPSLESWQRGGEITVSDWLSYENRWLYDVPQAKGGIEVLKKRLRLRGLVRAVWQRRLQRPHEWRSLHQWETQYCPHHLLQGVHNPARQRQSWSYIHSAIYQFCQYETIVTDRLHGHILCTLLNIPHVFLPNSYHKNASFYRHWTAAVPSSVFAETVEAVPEALAQLNAAQRESDQGGKGG